VGTQAQSVDPAISLALRQLHIDYINFITATANKPDEYNFWGIKSFKDYVTSFGHMHEAISCNDLQITLDCAEYLGYNLDL